MAQVAWTGRGEQRSFPALTRGSPAPPPHALCSQPGEEEGQVRGLGHCRPCLRSRMGGWTCRSESSGVCAPPTHAPPAWRAAPPLPLLCVARTLGLHPNLLGVKPFAHTSTAVQKQLPRAGRDLPRSHGEDTQNHMARSSKVIGDTQDHTTG